MSDLVVQKPFPFALLSVEFIVKFNQIVVTRIAEPDVFGTDHHLGGLQRVVAEPMLPEDAAVVVAERLVTINSVEIRLGTA